MAKEKSEWFMSKFSDRFNEAIRYRDRAMFQHIIDAWVGATEPGEDRQQLVRTATDTPTTLLNKVGGPFATWAFNALFEAGMLMPDPDDLEPKSAPKQWDMAGALAKLEILEAQAQAKTLDPTGGEDLGSLVVFFAREVRPDVLQRALSTLKIFDAGRATNVPLHMLRAWKPTPACLDLLIGVLPTTCPWTMIVRPWVMEWSAMKGRTATRAEAEETALHVEAMLSRLEAQGFDLSKGHWNGDARDTVKRVAAFREAGLKAVAKQAMKEAKAQGVEVGGKLERNRM